MITGEFNYSLDDKGRLMIPAKMRSEIMGNILILTRGIEKCLWLFIPEVWKKISESLMTSTSIFQEKARMIQRRFIAPAQEVEIDRSGRIIIPPTLRDSVGLKKECIVIGMLNRMEIWDEVAYREYWESKESEFQAATEEIGAHLKIN
jgi:MraZ protein